MSGIWWSSQYDNQFEPESYRKLSILKFAIAYLRGAISTQVNWFAVNQVTWKRMTRAFRILYNFSVDPTISNTPKYDFSLVYKWLTCIRFTVSTRSESEFWEIFNLH